MPYIRSVWIMYKGCGLHQLVWPQLFTLLQDTIDESSRVALPPYPLLLLLFFLNS